MGESRVESAQTLVMTARPLLYSRTLGAGHDSCGNRGHEGKVSHPKCVTYPLAAAWSRPPELLSKVFDQSADCGMESSVLPDAVVPGLIPAVLEEMKAKLVS